MNYQNAKFIKSATVIDQYPDDEGAEVAFAGRSNAGKSSALNTLTRQRSLARVSKTPGRTQLINFFSLGEAESYRLVDLPGYGFAKVSANVKKDWQKMIETYLSSRESLKGIILLVDIRHELKEFDKVMIQYAVDIQKPIRVLLTKADKLSKNQQANSLRQTNNFLSSLSNPDMCSAQTFSALKNTGTSELIIKIDEWLVK
jgi:GTP-binding protein